ncbi:MAG TPA: M1 family aminopeptidase [Polyangiaceae bacterium]|nr:M1 family aminopeptidase [Polyangiaceae bacterium]
MSGRSKALVTRGGVALFLAVWSAGAEPVAPFTDPEVLLDTLRPSVKAALPRTEMPEMAHLPRYELAITLDKSLQAYSLDERVLFTNDTGSRIPELVLRLFANATRSPPPIAFDHVTCGMVACSAKPDGPSAIRIVPAGGIAPDGSLEVDLHLDAKLPVTPAERTSMLSQSLAGLAAMTSGGRGPTDYGILGFSDGIAALGHCFAVVARRDRHGFVRAERSTLGDLGTDELSFVHAQVRAPVGVNIAATGVVVRDGAVDGVAHYTVNAGLVRDFTVLASSRFTSAAANVGDVVVRSHFLERDRGSGERVLDFAARALAVFENRFGPYPYKNLDVVEAPVIGGAGGVEFSGLVTVAGMFYRPAPAGGGFLDQLMAGVGQLQGPILEFTTAHEVAHQYFHGLVGSDSREHAFLDESLAQYGALVYDEDRYGKERAAEDADRHVRMNYRAMRLLGKPDGAVDQPVDAFGDPIRYAGLVYGKGPLFFEKARALLGDAAFFEAMKRYVRRYRFRMATPAGLRSELALGSPHAAELEKLARRWFNQTHGDDDLGKSDLGALLAGVLGGGAGGAGAARGSGGGVPSGADPKDLLDNLDGQSVGQLLRMLEGAMPDGQP